MDITKSIQLKPGEEVMLIVHGSLIPLWSKIALAFVWLVLPFFLLFPLFRMHLFGVVMFIILLVSALLYAYRTFRMWNDSVFVISDHRVIDIDRRGLFGRVVSEASLADIQDVSYTIEGFWATMFRYGTVAVRVKGNSMELQVFHVRRPYRVHDLINDLRTDHVSSN